MVVQLSINFARSYCLFWVVYLNFSGWSFHQPNINSNGDDNISIFFKALANAVRQIGLTLKTKL